MIKSRPLRICFLISFGLGLSVSAGAALQNGGVKEGETSIKAGAEADCNSRYVWRGFAWSEGAVLQPSAWITFSKLTFQVWGNYVLGDEPNHGLFNEMDIYLTYSREWKGFGIEPTFQWFNYFHQEDSPATAELSVKVFRSVGLFTMFVTPTWDVSAYAGAFFGEFGAEIDKELSSGVFLEGRTGLAYGSAKFHEAYAGLRRNALSLFFAELAVTVSLRAGIYLKPHAAFTSLLDKDIKGTMRNPGQFIIGIALGIEK